MKQLSYPLVALFVFGAVTISNPAWARGTPGAAHGRSLLDPPGRLHASAASPFQINLSWSDQSTNEDGFKIERSTDGRQFTQIAQVLANTTTYRDTGLFPGWFYSYRVRAFNAAGNSTYSIERRVHTLSAPTLSLAEWGQTSGPTPGESNWVAVAAGAYHGLALKASGTVVGWGDNSYGQSMSPTNLTGVVAIAAGAIHSLALRSDGTVVGWGDNYYGEATPPTNLTHVVAIAAGDSQSLALKNDGTLVQWSYDGFPPPTNLTGVVAIACGGTHSLALKSDGTVIGWGDDYFGEATAPSNLTHVVAIAAGQAHSLALKSDGTVVGWGYNDEGEATPPTNLTQVVAIAAGWSDSLALRKNGGVIAWGYDDGSDVTAMELGGVVAISENGAHRLTLTTAPAAPSVVKAKVISANQIALSWLDNSRNENGFKIERALDDGSTYPLTWAQIAMVGAGKTNISDVNAMTNVIYNYRVQAFNNSGNSLYSLPIAVRIAPLATPQSLAANLNTTNGVDLSWYDGFAGLDGFKVERAPDAGGSPGTWNEIATVNATNTDFTYFTDTSVSANMTYWYRVRAFNIVGTSPYADPVAVNVVPPNAPYYFYGNSFADKASLYWYDYSPVSGFKIERAPDLGGNPGTWLEISNIGSYFNSYTDTGLSVNTKYWYRVRAYNWVGDSDYTYPASVTIVPPAAPNSVSSIIGLAHSVDVSWNENVGDQDGFKLERAPDAGGSPGTWTEITSLSISNTSYASYRDTNVLANSVYWYRARAFNVLGISDYSTAASVNLAPPAAPMNLNASPFVNRVNLSWYDGSAGATGFKIERAPDANGAPGVWEQIAALDPAYFSYGAYTDTNRAADTTYWYRVRAFNWIGDSPYSDPAAVTIVPPAKPDNLAAAIGDTNQAVLSWYDSATDEDGFTVERAPDIGGAAGTWTQIAVINSGSAYYGSFIDTNATANTTNWYRVRAFNVVGISDYSTAVSISLVPPGAPTALGATPVVNRVNLYWNATPGGVMGFKIERAPDADGVPGTWAQIAMIAPSSYYSTYFTDTNRAADTTYWYRVQAFNWIGDSPYSDPAVVTIVPPATPSDPNAVLGNTNQAILSWYDSANDEDGFTVERAPDIGGGPGVWTQLAVINSGNIYNASYTDTNVTAYTTNWYRVRAFNVVGISDYAVPASVAIVPPVAPVLSAYAYSGRANLNWSDSDAGTVGITSFQIERAPDADASPGMWANIATVNGGNSYNYFTDPGGAAGTTNWYRVRAFNWVGGSPYSIAASVTIIPPATPNNLYGNLGTTNQVNLSWSDYSADEDGFKIECAPDTGGNPGSWTEIGAINATNYYYGNFTDTNVTANTTNWYRVRAFRAADISPYSDPASVAVVPPPAPTLSAYPFINQVNLSLYVYSAGVTSFNIERAPDAGGSPGTWTEIINTPNTICTDSNLAANATYWYRARAYNWVGGSPFCDPVSVTIVPPTVPYYLYGTVGTTNQVNLSWSDYSQDEDGFKVERAPDAAGNPGSWTEIGTVNATNFYYGNFNFTDTNATANTTNWYRIRAFNFIGFSGYSTAVSVSIVPPDAPNNMYAYPFKDSINTYWYEYYNGMIDGYKIERAPDAGGNPGAWTSVATNIGSFNSYTDPGRAANTKYWYRVRAFNWVGDSPYSSAVNVTILPPATPDYVYGTIGTTNQVTLSWYDYASDEDGIKFERAPDVAGRPGAWAEIGILNITNTYYGNFTDTNVMANTTNWYRVRAFNVLGTSGYSPTSSVSIIPPAAPYALYGTLASAHRIDLSWYDYDNIEGYKLERAPDNSGTPGTWTQISAAIYNSNYGYYSDLAVTTNKTYWYRVRAFTWVGDSPYSDAIAVNNAAPAAPASLMAVNDAQNQIALAWTNPSTNTSGFKIERAVDLGGVPASWIQIASVSGTTTSFTDTGLVTGKTYWYRVRAFNNVGNSPYSNETGAQARVGQFVRVMQWNVEKGLGRIENNYNYQPQTIARIAQYNQPDVLLFCEVDAQNLTAAQNQDAIINWVTNNLPYLGTQPGVTFFVAVSSKSDGFNRNAVVSRYPIAGETTFDDGLRGLHSFQVQLSDANALQIFHTHLKCCSDDCTRKQIEAQFDAGVIDAFALTNSLPYLFAGDWNEDEQNYECTPSSTYHPIRTIREGGGLVEFKPTALNGDYRTWSSRDASPSIRFDYILAATNRLSPVSGYVFSSMDWQNHGIYANFGFYDSYYASDHYCVFANYFFRAPALVVTPPDTLAGAGFQGGPFVHTNITYTLSNAAAGPTAWTIVKTASWISVPADAGTLASGASTNITLFINTNANALANGDYSDAITFSNATGATIEATRTVHLTVNDPALLAVTPLSDLSSLGTVGGPFIPGQQTYTLSNAGNASLTWTASRAASWVTLSATNGTLNAGAMTNVIVSISSNAVSLAAANYSDIVTFSNTTSGAGNAARNVNLAVTGFGFYDDFGTFTTGNLVGQKAWAQALASSTLPLKISGGRLLIPYPQSGDNQDAFKNFTVTSATLFYGMTIIISNAPASSIASPSYFAALYSGNNAGGFANFRLSARDNGGGTYVLGARITGQAGNPFTFGTTGLQYGTQHRVIVEADSDGTMMKVFVDPPSPDLPDQTPYLVNYVGSGTPPTQSGSFVFSQFNSASAPIVGFTIGKIAVIDNFATVFNDLADASSPFVLPAGLPANSVIAAAPLQITSILPANDDVLITWLTTGGTTNAVQASPTAWGIYTDISPNILIIGSGGAETNYLDGGAMTNSSARFYRIRQIP